MTFEGTKGTIYVDRKKIVTLPDELKKETFGDDEIHLYQSSNHYRNFIDCVISRKETVAPCGMMARAHGLWCNADIQSPNEAATSHSRKSTP